MPNDLRRHALQDWLTSQLAAPFHLTPLLGDASFRRYFRVNCDDKTFIAVDAPPDKEDSYPFITVGRTFAALNINVPKIFSFDLTQGFLLLSDLGSNLYQHILTAENATALYEQALEELTKIQACQTISDWTIPIFNDQVMLTELLNFRCWFLERHLQLKLDYPITCLLNETFEQLVESAMAQPQCCIHRDYHSRNLMVLSEGVGVLDFQDVAWGPITYDAVSLLRDCYITWPYQRVAEWMLLFYEKLVAKGLLVVPYETFSRWFDWMGIQRHLKAVFIFARKYHRDGVPDYLPYIDHGLQYVVDVTKNYPELHAFSSWLEHRLVPCYKATKQLYGVCE